MKKLLPLCLMIALANWAQAAVVEAGRLRANWDGTHLTALRSLGTDLSGVAAKLELLDPRTKQPVAPGRFVLQAKLVARDRALRLEGVVTAKGAEDTVADLVLRFAGVSLALGNGVDDMMLAGKLLNKLPLVSLRSAAAGQDRLALAMPADAPYLYEFAQVANEQAVTMRLPLGFTQDAPPALRMKAPFSIVLMATEPRWHFRSALAEYYRLFPRQFERLEQRDGGWFFANAPKEIPNPQHFAFFEGAEDLDGAHARGMGVFPYSETSSETIHLPGPGLPKDYAEAMQQLEKLETHLSPANWEPAGGGLDAEVKRSGKYSYCSDLRQAVGSAYGRQIITLREPINEPLIIEGWSKAEGVTESGNPGDYSIYVDCALATGGYQFGQCAVFRAGTHDWEKATFRLVPTAPLADLRVYTMLRNRTGAAWFDEVRIYRESKPDENLLPNGDFEKLGRRLDIQYCRDNAVTDPEGRLRFVITDNLSADVPPDHPLSLLRFACNVDPDWKAPEDRETPCRRATTMFDTMFKHSSIDGAYIDSVCAWCVWYLNFHREQWRRVTAPFTYDPKTFQVAHHGKFAMVKYLQYIGDRYHRLGKTIFGNMGPATDCWDNYTRLDIIGIESSQFRDRALMGYHRFGGYHKPVLPMNFVNLHKLDDRATAEEFVLSSVQWGEFPSTGRFVREGYESYGDVCHSYYPALIEMSRAGWEPQPLAEGVAAERFGGTAAVYYTVRAPQQGREATLTVLREAIAGLKRPVVYDAVQLIPVAAKLTARGLEIPLQDGAEELTILRVSEATGVLPWLLGRAAHHCENAARVRGKSENTARLLTLARDLRALKPEGLGRALGRLRAEETKIGAEAASLEKTSLLTELLDAERALGEWQLQRTGAMLQLQGDRVAPVSEAVTLTPHFQPGNSGATVLGHQVLPERNLLRLQTASCPQQPLPASEPLVVRRDLPGAVQVRTYLSVPVPGATPLTIARVGNVHFTPVLTASVTRAADAATRAFVYTVKVVRLAAAAPLLVKAEAQGVALAPGQVELKPQETEARFRVSAEGAGTEVVAVRFTVCDTGGRLLAEATSEFRNLPLPPAGNLALASGGATVTSDSSYPEYSPEVTIDGVWETTGLHWTKRAWASQDAAFKDGHWLEITLPKPTRLSKLWIYWAIDDNNVFSSRHYDVEAWDGKAWQPVAQVRDNPLRTVSQHSFAPVTTQKLRLHQLPAGGPARRPNIMWVSEVCLY